MLEENNIWSQKFNLDNLSEENWLTPDDTVLDGIEERIYDNQEKKSIGLFWILGLFSIALLGTGVFVQRLYHVNNTLISIEENRLSTKGEIMSTAKQDLVEKLTHNPNSTNTTESAQKYTAITQKEPTKQAVTTNINKSSRTEIASTNSSEPNYIILRNINQKAEQPAGKEPSSIKVSQRKLAAIAKINTTSLSYLDIPVRDKIDISSADKFIPEPVEIKKDNKFFLSTYAGLQKYKLNQNFRAAVNPADFTHTTANSIGVGVGYRFFLNSNFSLDLTARFEKTKFTSGHNSDVDYIAAAETTSGNTVTLVMATPLGFISGEALIQATEAVTEDKTLNLGLENAHEIDFLDLSSELIYTIPSSQGLVLDLKAGLGMKQLVSIANNLTKLDIADDRFFSNHTSVTEDQQTINHSLSYLTTGFELRVPISGMRFLGLTYDYMSGLESIHRQADLSTSISSHTMGIRLRF